MSTPRARLHDDVPKGRLTGYVLERLARTAALERLAQYVALFHGKRAVEVHVELDAREPRGGGEQPLGRELGVLVIMMREVLATPRKRIADGPNLLGHEAIRLPMQSPARDVRRDQRRQGSR